MKKGTPNGVIYLHELQDVTRYDILEGLKGGKGLCVKKCVCKCICCVLHARCHRPVPSKENDWLDLVSLSSTNHLTMTLTFLEHARALLVVPNSSVVVMHHVVNTPNRLFLTPRYIPNVHIISHPRCWCRCSLRSTAIPLQLPCGDWFVLLGKHYSKVLTLAPLPSSWHKCVILNVLLVSQHAFYHAC